MRWSEIETLKFVNIYLSHRYLWNPFDPHYKCRNKRQEAYKNIITGFHFATGILLDEVDIRVKIKNLRSTYVQEVAKIKERSGPHVVYTPSIKWFLDWHRCFNSIKQRMYISVDHQGTDNTDQHIWTQQNYWYHKISSLVPEPDGSLQLLKTDACVPASEGDHNLYKIKKKKFRHKMLNSYNQPADSTIIEDEFDIYGKYIASQLRRMDLQRALKVQLGIHNIVNEARISSLAET